MLAKLVERNDLKHKNKNNLSVIVENDEPEEIESIKKPVEKDVDAPFYYKAESKEE